MSIWDDPDMKVTDAYVKFEQPGDAVAGTITSVGIHRWDDGTACPKLAIDTDDGEVGLTAGQVGLKRALAEQRPEVGDHISVTFTDVEKRPGGKTLKHFDVVVTRAGAAPAAPAPAAPAPAAAAPAAAANVDLSDPNVQAALAALAAQKQ